MECRKKILYIEANQDGTIGGSYYCLLEIIKKVDKRKYEPIVCFYQDNILRTEFEKYCKVLIEKYPRGLIVKQKLPRIYDISKDNILLINTLFFIQKTFNFIKYEIPFDLKIIYILFKYKIDLIHINDAPVLTNWLLASKIFKIKCIAHLRGNWAPDTAHKKLARYYNRIISISNSVTKIAKLNGVNIENFVTIYDGIDVKAVFSNRKKKSDELRKELGIQNNDFLIGLVGNIKTWKGQHVAIEAVNILKTEFPEIRCLIIGDVSDIEEDKEYYNQLRQMIYDNNLAHNIITTGFRHDIPDIISNLDVLIHTSTNPEPLGRVILEGMVFAKPIIATDHGGPAEILDEGITGYLTPPYDSEALAKKIAFIMSHKNISQQVGLRARNKVEDKFNIQKNIEEIEKIYEKELSY